MMSRPAFLFASLVLVTAGIRADADPDPVERGAYLARIMDCAGCHMPRGADGVPILEAGLSGGNVGFEIPGLGVFWAPNLTPADTGLGSWTETEIADAIRQGIRPDGRILAPAMPWPSFAALSDEDVEALAAYLQSLPPVDAPRLDPVEQADAARAPFYRVMLPTN
ncbi:cytochrome c [Tropicimonas sp. IMCC6043]|uniref:c-type cytochrome n=1 Tax=Tropicimonas sp. IMCC6043 TaxID=2510645 RepID=UPI001A919D49|nr:cytochrome c [Tropicimonas sp. IMCC6043]